ncbi:hypothetical protein [Streptomyces sp. NPDC056983]|uniref:hypothetical protein n=1 Tax=Streptomyces sp. NPDC056983 TaxID=3345987 RepID=UPI0036320940
MGIEARLPKGNPEARDRRDGRVPPDDVEQNGREFERDAVQDDGGSLPVSVAERLGRMFDHIRSADRLVLFLNTVLLMDIAFLPFAASVPRHDRRLLATTIDAAGVTGISRRFQLAVVWLGVGILLGALFPVLGVAVISAFILNL